MDTKYAFSIGQQVRAKSGSLEIANTPVTGDQFQNSKRIVSGILNSTAIIVDKKTTKIDYANYRPSDNCGLGIVSYRQYLVETPQGTVGWAGEGALIADD